MKSPVPASIPSSTSSRFLAAVTVQCLWVNAPYGCTRSRVLGVLVRTSWFGTHPRTGKSATTLPLALRANVDLNPTRAGHASEPAGCEHTSIARQFTEIDPTDNDAPLEPVVGFCAPSMPPGLHCCLELVDLTGRIARPGKCGRIDPQATPVLRELGLEDNRISHAVTARSATRERTFPGPDARRRKPAARPGLKDRTNRFFAVTAPRLRYRVVARRSQ